VELFAAQSHEREEEGGRRPVSIPVRRRYQLAPDALTWEPSERWVRGTKGGVTVVDSRRSILVWEPGHPIPSYAFPRSDVRTDLLQPARAPAPDAAAHPGSEDRFDLVIDGEVTADIAWSFQDETLAGYLAFSWFRRAEPGLDHWYEEDEEVFQHPRNPFKRVDALHSTRHVRVCLNGVVAAETRAPVLVFETGVPTRYYIPRDDVRFDLLAPVELATVCPYKGIASEYWSWAGPGDPVPNLAWSYPDPLPAALVIKGCVAFYTEVVDTYVDGELIERPGIGLTRQIATPGQTPAASS
jgi:uncharacterized protein (DUF427 family)